MWSLILKKIILIFCLFFMPCVSFAQNSQLIEENSIQTRINECAYGILNSNKINKRIIFTYNSEEKKKALKADSKLTKREVIIYKDAYKSLETPDELAAYLSREISYALRSFDGMARGFLRSLQVSAAPKKYEIASDKRAVDYMVNSGYNPLGLIVHLQKTVPQKRYDMISTHNLTSKRLAIIYEYIYTKYPYYLKYNEYFENPYYQNFLLTSFLNRKLLEEKVLSGSKESLRYD